MAKFWRRRRPGTLRAADAADVDRLTEFVGTRAGVEAYVEPRTAVTDTTVVLVAADGEWTRRRVADPGAAAAFARRHGRFSPTCNGVSAWSAVI